MPKAPAGKAGSRCDDASRRHQHCRKNAFHDRYSSFCAAPRRPPSNHPRPTSFDPACFALTPLALIRRPTAWMSSTAGTAASKIASSARLIARGRVADCRYLANMAVSATRPSRLICRDVGGQKRCIGERLRCLAQGGANHGNAGKATSMPSKLFCESGIVA